MERPPYIQGPLHIVKCLGELTVMYLIEKAEPVADWFDNKCATLMDMGDE